MGLLPHEIQAEEEEEEEFTSKHMKRDNLGHSPSRENRDQCASNHKNGMRSLDRQSKKENNAHQTSIKKTHATKRNELLDTDMKKTLETTLTTHTHREILPMVAFQKPLYYQRQQLNGYIRTILTDHTYQMLLRNDNNKKEYSKPYPPVKPLLPMEMLLVPHHHWKYCPKWCCSYHTTTGSTATSNGNTKTNAD